VPGVRVASSVEVALGGADAAALVTEWGIFRQLDWSDAAARMRRAIIVDGRNALSAIELVDAGFAYASFGRGIRRPAESPTSVDIEAAIDGTAAGEGRAVEVPVNEDVAPDASPVERHRSDTSGLDLALTD
jgi:hypothetical protein